MTIRDMVAPSTPPQPATLFERYLAQCEQDAGVMLARVCRDAAASQAGGSVWAAPVQRKAREVAQGLARSWALQLKQLTRPQAPRPTPANAFIVSGFGVPTGLSLMSDDDVDEDVESTRLVQAIETSAEWYLNDVRSRLASAPAPDKGGFDDLLPLAPAKVVGALCACLHEQPFDADLRIGVMRAVAGPLAQELATQYQDHAELLSSWGIQPVRLSIRRDSETQPAPRAASGGSAAPAPAPLASAPNSALHVSAAQIPTLLAHVAGQAGLSSGMLELMNRLAKPVTRSVSADPRLFDSMDSPLWRLIDRLASLGQLDTATPAGSLELPLHLRLEPIIARLEQGTAPLPPQRYAQALAEAEAEALGVADTTSAFATLQALGSQAGALDSSATAQAATPSAAKPAAAAPPADPMFDERALSLQERRATWGPLVRNLMIDRLRDVPVLQEVKQFLLGPWLEVVTHVLAEMGDESAEAQRVLGAVESLIEAGSYHRRAPLTPAEVSCLRMEAEDGLATGSHLAPERARQHVNDLTAALGAWPRAVPESGMALPDELLGETAPEVADWPSHDELATVPISLDAHNPDERALRDCETWLDSLGVGDVCRLQRQGQWANLRLNWRNDPGTYFAFGNASGLAFCVSRRVLGRLRLEGLATNMPRGQWLRRAVDTMPMGL